MIQVKIEAEYAASQIEITENCVVRPQPETLPILIEQTANLAVRRAQAAFAQKRNPE